MPARSPARAIPGAAALVLSCAALAGCGGSGGPADTGNLSTMVKHDGKYLRKVSAYYDKLASEAPAQAGHEIQLIASAYQQLASSITSTGSASLTKIEQQITSLTTSGAAGNAFRQLIVYVTTKCG